MFQKISLFADFVDRNENITDVFRNLLTQFIIHDDWKFIILGTILNSKTNNVRCPVNTAVFFIDFLNPIDLERTVYDRHLCLQRSLSKIFC